MKQVLTNPAPTIAAPPSSIHFKLLLGVGGSEGGAGGGGQRSVSSSFKAVS